MTGGYPGDRDKAHAQYKLKLVREAIDRMLDWLRFQVLPFSQLAYDIIKLLVGSQGTDEQKKFLTEIQIDLFKQLATQPKNIESNETELVNIFNEYLEAVK